MSTDNTNENLESEGSEHESLSREAPSKGELQSLAQELVTTYRKRVAYYKEQFQVREMVAGELVDEELAEQVRTQDLIERLRQTPVDETSWSLLLNAIEQDATAALEEWEVIKEEACKRLKSGHDAAHAIHLREPWQKAQFLAVRQGFIDEWKPRGGLELRLIDILAQTYSAWLYWLDLLHGRMLDQKAEEEYERERFGRWIPPLVEEAEAQEQAGKMADRFHRMFMRTLRALRDLRRYAPGITIQNSGQVNIAGNQQVNNNE